MKHYTHFPNENAAELIHKSFEKSFLCVHVHAGHLSNLENSVEFNNQLEEFVSTVYY